MRLGRYLIERSIGSGAFAEVYLAEDEVLGRQVALKVLKPQLLADREALERFIQEARVLARIQHPQIAWVWDLGQEDESVYIALRYIAGPSLAQVLKERSRLPWAEALRIIEQVGSALDYAHNRGLVHRDVKPQNILVSEADGAVLSDFGLVRAMQNSGMGTRTGAFLGTPQYMPPEVWQGQGASPASDQYALACVLYELVTGVVLFDADTPWAAVAKHAQPPLIPESWPEGVPAEMGLWLKKALAEDPAKRFTSIAEFITALAHKSTEPERPRVEVKRVEKGQVYGGQVTPDNPAGIEWVEIPAGPFWMGCEENDPAALSYEKPRHKVGLPTYWISKYPVTNEQYQCFLMANPDYQAPRGWDGRDYPYEKGKHPVVHVSWQDAQAFCSWAKCRLPTEAEWEKAARGIDGCSYPWGEDWVDGRYANSKEAGVGGTTAVDAYPAGASPYGVLDMAGNVWEWVADWYNSDYYANSPGENPPGPSTGDKRVLRGGGWYDDPSALRAASRYGYYPGYMSYHGGFRCARSP
jgi:formylglycine-generating enzyme required for sulfatase activity/tRNA A-37 threonylcarbamoyl transferase component Bud32